MGSKMWASLWDTTMSNEGIRRSIAEHEKMASIFNLWDADVSGYIDHDELRTAVRQRLGNKLSSGIIIELMIALIDENADGLISIEELKNASMKIHNSRGVRIPSVLFNSESLDGAVANGHVNRQASDDQLTA